MSPHLSSSLAAVRGWASARRRSPTNAPSPFLSSPPATAFASRVSPYAPSREAEIEQRISPTPTTSAALFGDDMMVMATPSTAAALFSEALPFRSGTECGATAAEAGELAFMMPVAMRPHKRSRM